MIQHLYLYNVVLIFLFIQLYYLQLWYNIFVCNAYYDFLFNNNKYWKR